MTVDAVIFDIGNVLIEWQPEQRYDAMIGPKRRAAFFANVPFYDVMNRVDEGESLHDLIEATAKAYPDYAEEVRMLRDRWCDIAQPPIDHSVRLLRALRAKGVPVFVLSNFGAENFPLSEAQFPFLGEFDRRYISGVMGMRKPDPAIYAAVEADCGCAPGGPLFADDRQENIDAALARGWQGHLFETSHGWAQCLVDAGLLTAQEAA